MAPFFCSITYDPYSYKYKNIKSVINIWDKTFNICAFAYVCVHVCMPMYVLCVSMSVHMCACVCVHRCICQCMSMFVVQGWLTSVFFIDNSPLCFMRCVFWYQISLNLASLANNSCKDLHICLLSAGITSGCRGCLPFMWVLGLWALVFTLILQALYPHSYLPSHTVFVCLSPGYLV